MKEFNVEQFKVSQLSEKGLWLVSCPSPIDLGMLFWRAQEYYESSNPNFYESSFTLLDYINWYCKTTGEGSFTYYDDFEGYNLPGDVCLKVMQVPFPDWNRYDSLFCQVISNVIIQQGSAKFYLIGAKDGDIAVLEHEIAHGLYELNPKYRSKMKALIANLPANAVGAIGAYLSKEGYNQDVFLDEFQAYMSTGLPVELMEFEPLRPPFMRYFATARKNFFRKKNVKEKETVPVPEEHKAV